MTTYGQLLEAKQAVLSIMDAILDHKFTRHVAKLLPHLPNDTRALQERYAQLERNRDDPVTKSNLHRLICSVSTHGNLDSHSLMEACISIQAAKAQNILNVKRLKDTTTTVGDGRIIPKLEASRLYKNEEVVWARVVLCADCDPLVVVEATSATRWVSITDQVIELQWPYKKRLTEPLVLLLSHTFVSRIIFFSDLALIKSVCPDDYVVWSNLLSFYYCYMHDSVDICVESTHDWERLLSMVVLTRLFLTKSNLRLFGGNDTPITCMSGYNPYHSLRKVSLQREPSSTTHEHSFDEHHTPFNEGLAHPVYELVSNRDLQAVTGKSSIGGLNSTEMILHHIKSGSSGSNKG